jgi:hypothetical protein
LSLLVSLGSFGVAGYVAYRTQVRGAELNLAFGPEVLLKGRTHIGITCTFTNLGPRTGVITNLVTEVVGTDIKMRPVTITARPDELRSTLSGEVTTVEGTFTYYAPIPVIAGGQETKTIWFYYEPGWWDGTSKSAKTLRVSGYTNPLDDAVTSAQVEVVIDDAVLRCVHRHAVATVECPAPVVGWDRLFH